MAESFSKTVRLGDRGRDVRLAQEWLTFHGFATSIDGGFGPATDSCVRAFQNKRGLAESGAVDPDTQAALLAPVAAADADIAAGNKTLGDLVVAYARQHLKQHPVEIGGQNAGPWVRLYMAGNEGREWPWCAGFATFLLRHAARTLGVAMPHPYAFGCDFLAGVAKGNGRLLQPKSQADLDSIKPGYLFLVRRTTNSWAHIGVVEALQGAAMLTIEGNTNDSGSAEGFEVCRRTRGIADKDYLIV
ncbi:MAG: peptidoglycan-binding protein [Acidobacteria bacterium]|nr:peptidoglycan-binding protein [Acidobacteriota bacterium]